MLQSISWWDRSLHYKNSPGPLPHPLILYLCNLSRDEDIHTHIAYLGIGIPHHGNQQVKEEDHQQGNEEKPVKLTCTYKTILTNLAECGHLSSHGGCLVFLPRYH